MADVDQPVRKLVARTLEMFGNAALESEDAIVRALCAEGIPTLIAEKLVALVPLALGRVLIVHRGERVHFPTTVLLYANDGDTKPCDLRQEPIWECALELGTETLHDDRRALFDAAAACSAEVRCVMDHLEKGGGSIAGAEFANPIFLRISYEEWTGTST